MRTVYFFILVFFGFSSTAIADHITGGEMYYRQTGNANGEFQYTVTLKLFKNCRSSRQLLNPAIVGIFDRLTGSRIKDDSVSLARVETLNLTNPNKCITNPPDVCFEVGYYEFSVSLPGSPNGYLMSCQVSFRVQGIDNMQENYGNIGATYAAEIPATPYAKNTSAVFVGSDLVAVCANNSFTYSFAARDEDFDELRYSFCDAFQGGFRGGGAASSPAPPPYNSVPYGPGYDGSNPLGRRVSIDSKTGLIKGVAPGDGIYVVTVCVEEIRNGIVIATQRKDLQLNIASCTIAAATLMPEYLLCTSSTTLSIANNSTSPLIKTYNWELVDRKGLTVYTAANPGLTYNFQDTGLYKIKLVINKDLECSDSMESVARVYPGMVSDFDFMGICFKKPTQFISKASTVYGQISSLKWNFGEGRGNDNEIALPTTSYQYSSTGNKYPQLVVNTTTGCRDTVSKIVSIIEKPPLKLLFRDTLICVNDQLGLLAEGKGDFRWSPAVTLTNSNTASPVAFPQTSTTYFVSLDDDGCINQDSLKVRVVDKVLLQAMNDTIICQGDTIQLRLASNAVSYSWTSTGQVRLPDIVNPTVSPIDNTTYEVSARIGGCVATDKVIVTSIPYPKAFAGRDTVICFDRSVQLNGSTYADSFVWSPASSLSLSTILNPVAKPAGTTSYIIQAFDNKGCPKPGRDTVLVTVLPPIVPFAGRDTSAVTGQPLQLNATGGITYKWSPSLALSAADVSNPVAIFNSRTEDITYNVEVFNVAGCVERASVKVKIFSTPPSVFVPTAFTPNGDGKNDNVSPVAVGMKSVESFQIYNRWGNLVYSSPITGKGWDGTIAGRTQKTETFIWVVKAVDYSGKAYFQKGTITLIN